MGLYIKVYIRACAENLRHQKSNSKSYSRVSVRSDEELRANEDSARNMVALLPGFAILRTKSHV